jgi:hypothetical protein
VANEILIYAIKSARRWTNLKILESSRQEVPGLQEFECHLLLFIAEFEFKFVISRADFVTSFNFSTFRLPPKTHQRHRRNICGAEVFLIFLRI